MDEKIALLCQKLGIDENTLNKLIESKAISETDVELLANNSYRDDIMNDNLLIQFEQNLEAFKVFNKEIYERFKDYKPKRSFDFFTCDDGSVNVQYVDTKDFLYNSTTPKKYCQDQVDTLCKTLYFEFMNYPKQVDYCGQIHFRYVNETIDLIKSIDPKLLNARAIDSQAIPHCILLGVGLGYIVEMLYSKFDIGNMIIIEPNPDIFFASLYTFDWASLLNFLKENNSKLFFIIDKPADQCFYALSNYYNKNGCFLSAFKCIIASYQSKEIDDFIEKVYPKFYIFSQLHGFVDDALFGLSNGVDCLQKGKRLVRNDVLLKDYQKEYPVFVVGNGPSLDNDLPFLRKYQDKAMIIACGTAIDSLYNAGIKPDFYVATERTWEVAQSLDMFDGTHFLDDIILITANMVHPFTTAHFKKEMVFAKANEFLLQALAYNFKDNSNFKKWKLIQHLNPLVSNAGASVAVHLGFKNLYLFGIDNGRVAGTSLAHSAQSDLYNGKYKVEELFSDFNKYFEGNFGHKIESNLLFSTSCEYLSLLMEAVKDDVHCINCSDGMKIRATTPMHTSDINLDDKDDLDKEEICNYLLNDMTFKASLTDNELATLFNKDRYNYLVDIILKALDRPFTSRKEFTFVLQEISGILRKLTEGPDVLYASIVDSSTQFFFEQSTMLCYRIKDENKALFYAQKLLDLYKYLLIDSKHLFNFMPYYIQSEHLKLLNYTIGLDHKDSKAPRNFKSYSLEQVKKIGGKTNSFVKRYK